MLINNIQILLLYSIIYQFYYGFSNLSYNGLFKVIFVNEMKPILNYTII